MAARKQLPTISRRRLANELLELRGAVSRDQVSADTGISTGALFKMEKGQTRPQRRTLVQLLDYYSVEDQAKREALFELLRRSDELQWLQRFEDNLPQSYQHLISFEAAAARISEYEGSFVPGLLQTEAHAAAVIRALMPEATEEEIASRVEVRMRRQEALNGSSGPKLWVILDEAVIRRSVGGASVHRDQMRHLLEQSQAPNIALQVIPFEAGAHLGMPGQFSILEFAEPDPPMIYTENAGGGLFMEAEPDVARYRDNYHRLTAQAASIEQSKRIIEEAT